MAYDFDLFVIGAGSGGVRASRIAASHGARVAVAEEYRYGGTCVIRGCVPKKLFVYASHFSEDFEDAEAFGWTVGKASFDWAKLVANKDKEIDRLNGIYISMLDGAGVRRYDGRARLTDAHTIEVAGETVTAEHILLATGGTPTMPDVPGIEHAISSNEAFHLETLPEHITIVGGGYIAVEFAGIFNGLGRKVTQLYRSEQILRGFDWDVRNHLAGEIRKKGIDLRTDTNVTAIEKTATGYRLSLTNGESLDTGLIMYATGRHPNSGDMGLEAVGVELAKGGAVMVDAWSQTSVPNIHAVGDLTDRIALTPVALMEGHAFADTVFGNNPRQPNHVDVPAAVFSQPSVGTVGLTEEQARAEIGEVDIYKSSFTPMKHTLTPSEEKTLMKLIVDAKTDRVLGCHVVGPDAAEMVQGIGIALRCNATKAQFDATVGIHPSAAEELVTMRSKWTPPEAQAAE
ncbi:MAG: glutathione-disulfide reductase [Rhodospirillaceae bacterium]|jgi:glutathione reductase (NADPH)|nr:glutathione-disulfide reductase [Rhodospirillaceae bacterium]MBT3495243.1 glutathione-disulfide reductase [Rhodospirillaceae bacterium]MBT3780287.1 glutathione-disulfide reductase [Rhodospirillaceae bacterium]MBT3977345.1 glutathione-disulfide reductase [Rhodospirillaceae bacterium]MBT4167319.1 glutathione-disulfide reductase [Rhodospirillaceae bacterium]